MPRAGWCRECGEWVWVDGEGACQHGHSPECVSALYDAQPSGDESETGVEIPAGSPAPRRPDSAGPAPVPGRMVGVGEMPAEVYRFNWGAFLMPGVWGVFYGIWQMIALWLASILAPFAVVSLGGGDATALPSLISASVISEAVVGVARLWAGMNANRLYWQREQLRLSVIPDATPKFEIGKFLRRQRGWGIWGAIILAPTIAINVPASYTQWQKYQMGTTGVMLPLLWLFAEACLGAWLGYRMTVDGPDSGTPAEGRA